MTAETKATNMHHYHIYITDLINGQINPSWMFSLAALTGQDTFLHGEAGGVKMDFQ